VFRDQSPVSYSFPSPPPTYAGAILRETRAREMAGGLLCCGDIGTIAAALQAKLGVVSAGGVFATVQSAAMGGYGAGIVNGVVQALGLASGAENIRRSIRGGG
jgi:hypothetical protein